MYVLYMVILQIQLFVVPELHNQSMYGKNKVKLLQTAKYLYAKVKSI